jgi:5'-nucleotidase
MKILLTNDDGIYAAGLWALFEELRERHDISVVAPDRERSAIGHAITLYQPLRANVVSVNGGCQGYAVNGTPADCIKLGLMELMKTKPDIVISGINPGANVGVNINYSGTVAAAKEAALFGIPAIAVSVQAAGSPHYGDAARFVARLVETIREKGLPFGTILNVNCPDLPLAEVSGVRVSRQGIRLFADRFDKRMDPRDRPYYWQGCDPGPDEGHSDMDTSVLYNNFISITPIKCDMTDYDMMEILRQWDIDACKNDPG